MGSDTLQPIKESVSLKEKVNKAVKEAIISNVLRPGKIYSVPELANRFGVSRSPVREALLELACQGFVTFTPRRGVVVNEITEKELKQLCRFRKTLELAVLEDLFENRAITGAHLARIEKFQARLEDAVEDNALFLSIDREFHMYLARMTDNRFLISALEGVSDLINWTNNKLFLGYARSVGVLKEHRAIVDSLKHGDFDTAASNMEKHLDIALTIMIENFFENSPGSSPGGSPGSSPA